jgi:hypothetical protein
MQGTLHGERDLDIGWFQNWLDPHQEGAVKAVGQALGLRG